MSEREAHFQKDLIEGIREKIERAGEIAGIPTRSEATFSYYTNRTDPKIEDLDPEQLSYVKFLNAFLDEALEDVESDPDSNQDLNGVRSSSDRLSGEY
jgi:hypothetical protein